MSVHSGTLKQMAKQTTTRKGRAKRSKPSLRPAFIVTPSSQPTEVERQASAALFQRCVETQGMIRLRLDPRVYDPQRKEYVLLPGESISLQIFSREIAEGLLVGVRESLLNAE